MDSQEEHRLFDAKLAVRDERISGHWTLDDERWTGHKETHVDLADSLRLYKSEANEWRSTIGDLRGLFIPRAEYQAKHDALDKQFEAISTAISDRVTTNATLLTEQVNALRRPNWQLLVAIVALILALYGSAIKPLQDQVTANTELLTTIAQNGSPITQERLNRIETRLFGPTATVAP